MVGRLQWPVVGRFLRGLAAVCLLCVVALLLRPVEQSAWRSVRAQQVELSMAEVEGALGQGLVLGVLGGFRTIVADFLWLKLNQTWEQKERAKLHATLELVTTLDPRSEFFWINGARMLAYDVPHWRVREEGGYTVVPESRRRELDREQAEQAFALLERALRYHPENPKIHLEFAQIYLNRLKDSANAAKWFLSASKLDGAPFFAARIHGELLRRQGLLEQAYEFYVQLYRELPEGNPFAQKPVVLDRIRELEQALGLSVEQRFVP